MRIGETDEQGHTAMIEAAPQSSEVRITAQMHIITMILLLLILLLIIIIIIMMIMIIGKGVRSVLIT